MNFFQRIKEFNDKIAITITLMISNMWCVYAFIILVSIPFVFPAATTAVQFISSAFLQLIFLPLILVGQALLGKTGEDRAEYDHEAIMDELAEIKAMHNDLKVALKIGNTSVEVSTIEN